MSSFHHAVGYGSVHDKLAITNCLRTLPTPASGVVESVADETRRKALTLRRPSAIFTPPPNRLRLHMADPCTKSEVSSVSRCGDITWGIKF